MGVLDTELQSALIGMYDLENILVQFSGTYSGASRDRYDEDSQQRRKFNRALREAERESAGKEIRQWKRREWERREMTH
jgi:hypothetical protein